MIFNIGGGHVGTIAANFATLFQTAFGVQGTVLAVEPATALAMDVYGLMDTPKNIKHTSRRLLRLLMEQKARFLLIIASALFFSLLMSIAPLILDSLPMR